jgi:hypothetical protein
MAVEQIRVTGTVGREDGHTLLARLFQIEDPGHAVQLR